MLKPWGPSAINSLGFVAHQASLAPGGSFGGEKEKHISPRQRLLAIMDTVKIDELPLAERSVFKQINRNCPWLLSSEEKAFLLKLQSETN